MLQCPRCGGRTVLTAENGVIVKGGRRKRGTVLERDVCANCWKEGIVMPMQALQAVPAPTPSPTPPAKSAATAARKKPK